MISRLTSSTGARWGAGWDGAMMPGLAIGLGLLAFLVALDGALGRGSAVVGPFLLAAFVPAFMGSRRATLIVAVIALAAAALSGFWNNNAGAADYWARTGLVAFGGALAFVAATVTASSAKADRRFAILDRVAEIASGTASAAEALDQITALVVPEIGEVCVIDVVTPDRRAERVVTRATPSAGQVERTLAARAPTLPADMLRGDTIPQPRVFPTFGPEAMLSLARDDEDLERIKGLALQSAMTVPLIARGRCTGAMSICSLDPARRYTDEDVRFATLLSGRVALVLDSAGLFTELQAAEGRMERAMAVLEEAIVIHDRSGKALFANDAAVSMLRLGRSEGLDRVSLASLRDRFDLYGEDGEPVRAEDFAAIRALRGEPVEAQIIRAASPAENVELWLRVKSSATLGSEGRPDYVVTALEDITDLKRVEFDQTVLARLGELLASSLDYQTSVARLSEIVVAELADWCSVFAAREDGAIIEVATAHRDPEQARLAREILTEYPLQGTASDGPGRLLRDGMTINIGPVSPFLSRLARDDRHLELMRKMRLGAVMILPLRNAGRVVGALVLGNEDERSTSGPADQALAERIALRAAGALDNARLATERTEIAETLQRGLLPAPLPDIPGWDLAAFYRPAGTENEVGGDFYDAFPFEGGWMIVIGDVTGRGARAASVTGQARHTVRAAATLTGDPLATLATLNRTLLTRHEPALCSLAAIALDAGGTRRARVAVAGHPPPLLVGPGGVREAAGTGPVLGAFSDARWDLSSVEVGPSEQIVIFTDGVTEAEGFEGRFGEERLRSQLEGLTSPGASVAVVSGALDDFCSGTLGDDAALLALSPHDRDRGGREDIAAVAS